MQADRYRIQVEPDIALLYRKYAPELLIYVRHHLTSQEDAEDVIVDVFLAAIESTTFSSLSEQAKQSWFWRVTRNKVIDVYRRSKTRLHVYIDQAAESLFADELCSPENSVLRLEASRDLSMHLQRLPTHQQEILRLRFGHDLSCSEIATVLGKRENVVRVTLSRSLNLLRKIYRSKKEEE